MRPASNFFLEKLARELHKAAEPCFRQLSSRELYYILMRIIEAATQNTLLLSKKIVQPH